MQLNKGDVEITEMLINLMNKEWFITPSVIICNLALHISINHEEVTILDTMLAWIRNKMVNIRYGTIGDDNGVYVDETAF